MKLFGFQLWGRSRTLADEAGLAARYAVVGLTALLAHAGIAVFGLSQGWSPLAANAAGFAAGFAISTTGHMLWTFDVESDRAKAAARFFIASMAALAVSELAVLLAEHLAPDTLWMAAAAGVATAPATSFLLARFWAFRAHTD